MSTISMRGDRLGTLSGRGDIVRRERRFFQGVAIVLGLGVLAGFARSYYLKIYFHRPPQLDALLHIHGLLMSSWVALLITQVLLIGKGRPDFHRRLGKIGLPLAVAMSASAVVVAIVRARRHIACSLCEQQTLRIAVPLVTAVVFVALVAAAIKYPNRADIHKRLIVVASVEYATPAIGRLPIFDPLLPNHLLAYKIGL